MKHSYFFVNGNQITVAAQDSCNVMTSLPTGTYTIKKNPDSGNLFLETMPTMSLPQKIYGDVHARADRIINTFNNRTRSTGVLLSGDKGSGKTMLTKVISAKMMENNVPVIIVNSPWCGPAFNQLIGNITQPAVVIFDEFDKVYDDDEQKELLTLLDGTIETKKLFIFTTNTNDIDDRLINRPGRIYYSFEYEGLDQSFVRQYAEDTIVNRDHIEQFVQVCSMFSSMTFDMMSGLVEEMNRYGEDVQTVMEYVNVDITKENTTYSVSVLYNGKPINNTFYPYVIDGNPLFTEHCPIIDVISAPNKTFTSENISLIDNRLRINKDSLHKVTSGGKMYFTFTANTNNDVIVILERQARKNANWLLV